MKFRINQKTLAAELAFLQPVVEKKSTIPVLSNVLIESVNDAELRIVGTDLDVTLVASSVKATIEQPGAICVSSKKLFEIVRLLPAGGEVEFVKENNQWVKIRCAKSNFRIAGVGREDFPETPKFVAGESGTALEIPLAIFIRFVGYTSFAITNEHSRFTLAGAKFIQEENGSVLMVTTDGHRLAYICKAISTVAEGNRLDTLIPKKALSEVAKIARAETETSGKSVVKIGEDFHHIYFQIGSRLITCRKLSGAFPNYEMVIPKDTDKRAGFAVDDLRAAIRRVSLMADERTGSIKLIARSGSIEVRAQASEEGEGSEVIDADFSGDETGFAYNSKYLLDFLILSPGDSPAEAKEAAAFGARRASLNFKDNNSQSVFRFDDEPDFLCVVMPLRF